jgi:hypothetical protein
MNWTVFALLSSAVIACHAVYFFLVYRARVLTHSAFASSDLSLFYLPVLVVFAGFASLLRRRGTSWVLSIALAFLLTFVSVWLSLLIPFNMYGT